MFKHVQNNIGKIIDEVNYERTKKRLYKTAKKLQKSDDIDAFVKAAIEYADYVCKHHRV